MRGVVDRRPCTSGTPPWQCFPQLALCPMAAHPNSEEFIIGPPTTSGALKILSDEGFQQTDSNKNNSERYFVSQIEDQSLPQS